MSGRHRFMRYFAKRQRTDGETGDPPSLVERISYPLHSLRWIRVHRERSHFSPMALLSSIASA